MNKPHVHKDVIIAYANGANIQYCEFGTWIDTDAPSFHPSCEYRIKPEREYPVTSLSMDDLYVIYAGHCMPLPCVLVKIANAAIKQYIIDTEGK